MIWDPAISPIIARLLLVIWTLLGTRGYIEDRITQVSANWQQCGCVECLGCVDPATGTVYGRGWDLVHLPSWALYTMSHEAAHVQQYRDGWQGDIEADADRRALQLLFSEPVWIIPTIMIVLALLLAWLAGKSVPPTDRERYFFNGDPTQCIACGRPLRRTVGYDVWGKLVTVRCPMYGGLGSEHEFYRWTEYKWEGQSQETNWHAKVATTRPMPTRTPHKNLRQKARSRVDRK